MCMQVHGFPLMSLLLKKIVTLLARRDVYLQEAPFDNFGFQLEVVGGLWGCLLDGHIQGLIGIERKGVIVRKEGRAG